VVDGRQKALAPLAAGGRRDVPSPQEAQAA